MCFGSCTFELGQLFRLRDIPCSLQDSFVVRWYWDSVIDRKRCYFCGFEKFVEKLIPAGEEIVLFFSWSVQWNLHMCLHGSQRTQDIQVSGIVFTLCSCINALVTLTLQLFCSVARAQTISQKEYFPCNMHLSAQRDMKFHRTDQSSAFCKIVLQVLRLELIWCEPTLRAT